MKKHTVASLVIWFCVLLLSLVAVSLSLFSQDQDSTRKPQPCPCDSAFVRRVNYRIDRQLDWNHSVWSDRQDQKQFNAVIEKRIDSLRAIVQEWTEKQQAKKPKK